MEKLSGNELLQHKMLRDIDDVFHRRGVDAGSVERKLSLGEGKSSLTVHFREKTRALATNQTTGLLILLEMYFQIDHWWGTLLFVLAEWRRGD